MAASRLAAESDSLRVVRERRDERQAGSDGFGVVGETFAGERLAIAKAVGEQNRLAILPQSPAVVLRRRMHGLSEEAEAHAADYSKALGGATEKRAEEQAYPPQFFVCQPVRSGCWLEPNR